MKISELVIGNSVNIPLVVYSATSRLTKNKKPYLALEFYDGVDKINANYWDWGGVHIPAANSILNVACTVGEWAGVKQLTVSGLTTNNTLSLADFSPSSGHDIQGTYNQVLDLVETINDDFTRSLVLGVLETLKAKWLTVPGAIGVHHAYVGGTLIHSHTVARTAKAIAGSIPEANVDIVVAGALLHDIGKLFTYRLNGVVIDMTDDGKMLDHLFIGAEFIGNFVTPDAQRDEAIVEVLRHIILSHHGALEHGAVVLPSCLEAHIVHCADKIDTAAEIIRDACRKNPSAKFTDRLWALGNKTHLTFDYMANLT